MKPFLFKNLAPDNLAQYTIATMNYNIATILAAIAGDTPATTVRLPQIAPAFMK
jgi:hypothetical protein